MDLPASSDNSSHRSRAEKNFQTVFERPVRVGQAVGVHAELLHVGNSSMDIKLEVWARRLLGAYEAEHQLMTEGVFGYVAGDEYGTPRRVVDNPRFFSRSDTPSGHGPGKG